MKSGLSFWRSLESYAWKVVERVSPALPYFGVGLIVMVVGASIMSSKTSVVDTSNLSEASVKAARAGDYTTAQYLLNLHKSQITNSQNVLGVVSEIEDLVFPERVVIKEIESYEELLERYPGHRDIYLTLAKLYEQVEMSEDVQKYYDLARELDPNNPMVKLEIRN